MEGVEREREVRVAVLPEELEGHKVEIIELPDPGTGKPRAYGYFSGKEGVGAQILEASWYKNKNASWFVGEEVVSSGGLVLYTKTNPVFFLLSALGGRQGDKSVAGGKAEGEKAMFCTAEHILECFDGSPRKLFEANLQHVCDQKSAGGESYFRYSEEKAVEWLKGRVARLQAKVANLGAGFKALDEEGLKRYSASYLREYLGAEMLEKLEGALGLPPVSSVPPPQKRPAPAATTDSKANNPTNSLKRGAPDSKAKAAAKEAKVVKFAKGSMKISSFFQRKS
ncbi:subunit B of ribonuclease H2 [Chloropicon primus]|uniref:Subunit B of ribonuclease H2 n=1 Tax=Chloropicon primus TaxID=1764295 RepID=A0A5B8MM37_9CHLO|nr:subunit B of ribonuclease H2 [Chloropicon primus]UPQ99631.1 subunit B of ribonuclease H2 [Chloropicon primus]|mmetsp:Transcript_8865/g.25290  ORF Transcript_8865/g.25290 Transcript_8865/m.25290 type:complete len:282 (-) Transcript_8865:95-940(-)|eukprot:QDZ20422.1 subunit B of ribonuclease H2 [Chloropicon primus]